MAAKQKTKTPVKGKQSKTPHRAKSGRAKQPDIWQDNLGIGYATYDHEEDYVSPASINEEQTNSLQNLRQRLALVPIFAETDTDLEP